MNRRFTADLSHTVTNSTLGSNMKLIYVLVLRMLIVFDECKEFGHLVDFTEVIVFYQIRQFCLFRQFDQLVFSINFCSTFQWDIFC